MAHGGNFVGLDKGWKVLTTYNSSHADGVTPFRCVKLGAADDIDLNTTDTVWTVGVVQERVDRTKVATGKVIANVRMGGITKVYVADTPGTVVQGSPLACGSDGGVKLAATGDLIVGRCLTFGTSLEGDLVDMLMTSPVVSA
jgi:hypothetical protein